MQLGVGFAVGAGFEACGEEAAGFVAADRAAPLARDVAVAGVDLDGGAVGADAEFDDPVRALRPAAPAAFFFRLPSLHGSLSGRIVCGEEQDRSGRDVTIASEHSATRSLGGPKPALIRRRALSAWSRTWSAPRRRETSGSPPGSGSPSCPGL